MDGLWKISRAHATECRPSNSHLAVKDVGARMEDRGVVDDLQVAGHQGARNVEARVLRQRRDRPAEISKKFQRNFRFKKNFKKIKKIKFDSSP